MNNIESFGFSVIKEKANYPWASPEAAIESLAQECFITDDIIPDLNMLNFEEGTEGFIGDAWNWFVNLVKRFWNWITGNNKKTKNAADTTIKKADESIKIMEETKSHQKGKKDPHKSNVNKSDNDDITLDKIRKGLDSNATFVFGGKNGLEINSSDQSKTEELNYLVPNLSKYLQASSNLRYFIKDMRYICNSFKNCNSWKEASEVLIENKVKIDDFNDYSKKEIMNALKELSQKPRMESYNATTTFDLDEPIKTFKSIKHYVKTSIEYKNTMQEFADILNKKFLNFKDTESLDKNVSVVKDTLVKTITQLIPKVYEQANKVINILAAATTEATEHNKKVAAQLNQTRIPGVESFDMFGFVIDGISNVDYKTEEGFESICNELVASFSELDAMLNQHFDENTFFGGLEAEDTKSGDKLPFHTRVWHTMRRAWDAIKRFFLWIGGFFSDKLKGKYEIEKLRAELNASTKGYKYVSASQYEINTANETFAGKESENINIFDIGFMSGLEAVKSLILTDYKSMNDNISSILDYIEDLGKFTRYFIDMVTTGKANATEFRKLITPGLKDLSTKLNNLKFPSTITVDPSGLPAHVKEANRSLDYCKEFEKITNYMAKNKVKIDRFFARPELTDNELAKEMVAALNRYYIPAMKQLVTIFQWYTRCIESDIKKIKNNK